MECIVSTTKNEYEIYLHTADVRYHHGCWLGVTSKDIAAAWEKMSNTCLLFRCSCNNHYYCIGLVQVQQTAQIIGYCYTSTGTVQVYQTCMLVGASLTDMKAG